VKFEVRVFKEATVLAAQEVQKVRRKSDAELRFTRRDHFVGQSQQLVYRLARFLIQLTPESHNSKFL